MTRACLLCMTFALATSACGDDGVTGSDGSTSADADTGTPPTSTSGTPPGSTGGDATDSTGTPPGTDSGSDSGDTGPSDSTGATGGSTDTGSATDSGGTSALVVTMDALQFFQDCMPIVPPDPLGATFTLELENVGAVAASADVVSATLRDAGGASVGTIGVTPTTFGPVDPAATLVLGGMKTAASLDPPNGCGVAMCNQTYTLELELDIGGETLLVADSATVDCVF